MRAVDITVILAALAASAAALPSGEHYVLHESRSHRLHGRQWKRGDKADGDAILPLKIGLTQTNLHTGYDRLMDVSHPSSASFGQHLTKEQVADLFAPTEETVQAVREWLIDSGIAPSRIVHYENKGWLSVDLPVKDAEALFRTQYYEVEHRGSVRLGVEEYHLPKHIQEHVDYITPGVKLSPPLRKRKVSSQGARSHAHAVKVSGEPYAVPADALDLPADVQGCGQNFGPACYRALYNIPANNTALEGNSVGLFEMTDTYSQEDINLFFAHNAPWVPNGTAPIPAFIDGADAPVAPDSVYNTGESDIDIDIIQSLVYPQTITLYQNEDRATSTSHEEGFLNTFLDALDGSYCNYTAFNITGNSPGIDASYPDLAEGGWKGDLMCGTYEPTRVVSISYGEAEVDLPKKYIQRQCNEWMKLGLQGHTFLIASGDYGVAGFPDDASDSGCLGENGTVYTPDYPTDCPYVTSVGATQLQVNQTIKDAESAMQVHLDPEGTPQYLFASAGGFSNDFPAPDYQKDALATYFSEHDPGHPTYVANDDASNIGENGGLYNRAGRGFPDISANGAMLEAWMDESTYLFYGTSLAAPLWASVVTLINQERQAVGKGPVGFINPVLYANAGVLTDIKNGSNPNCGSSGFDAVEGWDPITGLGTPIYPKLLELYLSLP